MGAPGKTLRSVQGYMDAVLESKMALGRVDGLSNDEIARALGLEVDDVGSALYNLTKRVRRFSEEMARNLAVRQTVQLTGLFSEIYDQWSKTHDPRYGELLRGCLADVRKIWGVESPKRVDLSGDIGGKGGVLGGILGLLGDGDLAALESVFVSAGVVGSDSGGSGDGEGLSSSEGLRSPDSSV